MSGRTRWPYAVLTVTITVMIFLGGFILSRHLKPPAPAINVVNKVGPVATPAAPELQLVRMPTEEEFVPAMGGEVEPDDPQAREVRKVGNHLAARSAAGKSPHHFRFHLAADTKTANAFAFPDGQILVTRGLLERLGNESELAGVLGHECAHVVAGHCSLLTDWVQLNQSMVLAQAVGNRTGGTSAEMRADFRAKLKEFQVLMCRNESAADLLALQFMVEAGYDPRGMNGLMRVVAEVPVPAGSAEELMWTHPDRKHRMEDIDHWIEGRFPKGVPASLTEGVPLDHGIPAQAAAPTSASNVPLH